MDSFQCRICNNTEGNTSYIVQEMMFGLGDQFLYFKCSQCGCLQIAVIPLDMRRYYPAEKYYSYKASFKKKSTRYRVGLLLRNFFLNLFIGKVRVLNLWPIRYLFDKKEYKWMLQLKGLKLSSNILDVGCGTGSLLLEFKELGFENLTGVDPFIEKDILYPNGVTVLKKNIVDLNKQYDLVMLNHAFEHMDNPNDTFKQFFKLLKTRGWLIIRIPVVDCLSWRKYGVSWYQLDAPRHFFLHTVRSMSILSKKNGLDMLNVEYDSDVNQFCNSEKYIRNESLSSKIFYKPRLIKKWQKYSKWLNDINDGDQACFIFFKK